MRSWRADQGGVLVAGVYRNSPAATAGIRPGDVITHIGGEVVVDSRDALNRIAGLRPGTTVALKVVRSGEALTLEATVGERATLQPG